MTKYFYANKGKNSFNKVCSFFEPLLEHNTEVNDIEECDYILYACKRVEHASNVVYTGKPYIILMESDEITPIKYNDPNIEAKIYRTSLKRNKKQSYEKVLPAHLKYSFMKGDSKSDYETNTLFTDRPSICFCGNEKAHPTRRHVIENFKTAKGVDFDCIARGQFVKHYNNKDGRSEFLNQMGRNMFSLCPRGAGNWSVRFYESLMLGRIPVVPDTDIEFPLENYIDWSKIVICENSFDKLYKKVLKWHNYGKEFIYDRQIMCNKVYEDFLSTKTFYKYL